MLRRRPPHTKNIHKAVASQQLGEYPKVTNFISKKKKNLLPSMIYICIQATLGAGNLFCGVVPQFSPILCSKYSVKVSFYEQVKVLPKVSRIHAANDPEVASHPKKKKRRVAKNRVTLY